MIDSDLISDLTSSLNDYNPTLNQRMADIAASMEKVAIVLVSILFAIEILNYYQHFKAHGGGITVRVWIETAAKYLIAIILISYTAEIFDAILWLTNKAIKFAGTNSKVDYEFVVPEKGNKILKWIVTSVGAFVEATAKLVVKILVMLRFIQMYIYKAVAPIMVSFFMSDSLRPIVRNFLLSFAAVSLQGLLLFIICLVYPALVHDDLLTISSSGFLESFITSFASIAKGIVFIFLLTGSQRLAKQLMTVQ